MNNWNDPINDPDNYKYGIFYYNPDDDRIIVPKVNQSLGWTLNFAKQETYIFATVLISFLVIIYILTS